jgi:hypothetical protein
MSHTAISDIWGWLLAEIAFVGVMGLIFLIPGIRAFMHGRRGPINNLYDIMVGVLLIGSSTFQLFVLFVPPTTISYLRVVVAFGLLLATIAIMPFFLLISRALLSQYSLPPSAPLPRWLRRWIEQQKSADAESGVRMKALVEARREARAARRQA